MAAASLPEDPDLDQLRNQARELQRAVRRGEPAALTLVSRWHPGSPQADRFPLTAAQLVLARQHGFTSWARMRRYIQIVTARAWTPGQPPPGDEPLADRFLRLACLTYSDDQLGDRLAAAQLLAEHPELPRHNLFAAAACADAAQVRRHLVGQPAGAIVTGGPHGWSPLLYQAYARHNPHVDLRVTLETTRLLLDAGADPNDGRFWHALPTPFTVLTGVLGYGEHRQPWHPHSSAFARLLLERGADPNDGQTLYNRMFGSDDHHLVLLFEYGLGSDTRGPWHRLLGESLESPTEMLRSLLAWAIVHDQRHRVALLAEHGVDVVSTFTEQRSPHRGTPVEVALIKRPPRAGQPAPRSRRPAGAALSCRRLRRGRTRRGHRGSAANSRAGHRHRTTKADRVGDLGRGPGRTQRGRTARHGRLRRQRTRPQRYPQQPALAHRSPRRRRER
jgi:hypothetical protein